MRETRSSGSVRGASGDGRPYRERSLRLRRAWRCSSLMTQKMARLMQKILACGRRRCHGRAFAPIYRRWNWHRGYNWPCEKHRLSCRGFTRRLRRLRPYPEPERSDPRRFPAGRHCHWIEVSAVDRLALRGAELVAPDGHVTPALSINVNPTPTTGFSQGAWAAPITSANYGVSSIGSNALTPDVVGAAPQSQTTLLAMVSTASIQLPDPIAYRRDWQQYRIRLRLGDPPQNETREIAFRRRRAQAPTAAAPIGQPPSVALPPAPPAPTPPALLAPLPPAPPVSPGPLAPAR